MTQEYQGSKCAIIQYFYATYIKIINLKMNRGFLYMKNILSSYISRLNLYLLLINFSIWGILVRYLPQSQFSPYFTHYRVNVIYGTFYLLKNYHTLNASEIPMVSAYGNLIGYNNLDIGFQYINAFILTVLGIQSLDKSMFFFRLFPWQSIFLVPITAVLVYMQICKVLSKQAKYIDFCLVYMLSSFFSYNYLGFSNDGGTNPIYGVWILLMFFYLFLKVNDKNTPQKQTYIFFIILFSLWIQTIYHTSALIIYIIMFSITILQYNSKLQFMSKNMFVLYSAFFISYIIYIATTYLYSYTNLISSSIHIFETESLSMPSKGLVNVSTNIFYIILQFINYILLITPIVIFTYQTKIKNKYQDNASKLLYYFILSLGVVLFFHFIWKGFVGVERGFTYCGLIISLIAFSYLLADIKTLKNEKKLFLFLSLSIILICSISTYSYITRDISSVNSLTYSEEGSVLWGSEHIPKEDVIFSDLRLGTPFLFFDYFKLLGIHERPDPQFAKYSVESIFYSDDVEPAIYCLNNIKTWSGESSDYLVFSKGMTEPTPSFRGSELSYKPAPKDFIEKYNYNSKFYKLYENGYAYIYYFQK